MIFGLDFDFDVVLIVLSIRIKYGKLGYANINRVISYNCQLSITGPCDCSLIQRF